MKQKFTSHECITATQANDAVAAATLGRPLGPPAFESYAQYPPQIWPPDERR